jgi:hypothetical protein
MKISDFKCKIKYLPTTKRYYPMVDNVYLKKVNSAVILVINYFDGDFFNKMEDA